MKKIIALLLVAIFVCTAFVACDKPQDDAVTYDLDGATAYVEGLYKEELSVTAVDFNVVSQVIVDGVTYTIDWSVDSDKVTVGEAKDGVVVIGVDEKSPEEVEYKLTATVKAGDGTSQAVTFKLKVPEYNVNSHEEYMAAQQDDMLTIEGIVVAINSKDAGNKYNHLFLADASVKGGYYCYSITQDPVKDLGIKVGMTVKVTGPMAPYSGMQEIKGGQVAIVDSTIKTVETLDITEKFTAGENLGAYVGLPVTIKGVTIGNQALEKDTDQYLNFAIGEKKSYLRTYVTDFPTNLKATDKEAIDKDHKDHFGYKADVTGILVHYNSTPYLIPMSLTPFTNYEEVVVTPAERVDAELGDIKIDASFSSDAVVTLPLVGKYYDNVTLSWKIDGTTTAATLADGKLTIVVPDKEETIKVVVTATCGTETKTKTFEIKLSKKITPIKDLLTLGAAQSSYTAEKYIAGGIITEVQQATYGNIVIKDENGDSILVYGTFIGGKKYGEADKKPVVGDYVVVVGVVGQYKGTAQMKNADITYFVAPSTVNDAITAGSATASNVYSEDNYLLTGVITEVQNDKYGNVVIKGADDKTILLYGLYDQVGTRYDGMAKKPAVGDTITVFGPTGNYKGTAQIKNATLVGFTAKAE